MNNERPFIDFKENATLSRYRTYNSLPKNITKDFNIFRPQDLNYKNYFDLVSFASPIKYNGILQYNSLMRQLDNKKLEDLGCKETNIDKVKKSYLLYEYSNKGKTLKQKESFRENPYITDNIKNKLQLISNEFNNNINNDNNDNKIEEGNEQNINKKDNENQKEIKAIFNDIKDNKTLLKSNNNDLKKTSKKDKSPKIIKTKDLNYNSIFTPKKKTNTYEFSKLLNNNKLTFKEDKSKKISKTRKKVDNMMKQLIHSCKNKNIFNKKNYKLKEEYKSYDLNEKYSRPLNIL